MGIIVRGQICHNIIKGLINIMNINKTTDSKMYLKKVGSNIRQLRKKKNISQESLALSAELDRSYVGSVERGERNIAILNLKKIADTLGVPVSHLFKGI